MSAAPWLNRAVALIVAHCAPARIVLFGSAARAGGRARDLDLLVVSSSDRPRGCRAPELAEALRALPVRIDLIFVTPSEAEAARADPRSVVATALAHGLEVHSWVD